MNKTKFLIILLIINIGIITNGQATVWTVASSGSSNDGVRINQAIQTAVPGDIIYLLEGVYTITAPIQLKTGVYLQGAGCNVTTIYVPNKADFNNDDSPAMLVGVSDQNIEISGINFKGPGLSPADIHDKTQAYYGGHGQHHAAMRFTSCTNIRVHDCSCELLLNDFVRTSRSSYIYVYNNVMNMHGHDGCQLYRTSHIYVYNNYIVVYINCGVRVSECTNATICQNTFTSYSNSGWNGVQIQGGSTKILISKNVFSDMKDNYGCVGLQTSGSGCTIRDNVGYNVPAGMLHSLGSATVSNNEIYKLKQDWVSMGYGYNGKGGNNAVPSEMSAIDFSQDEGENGIEANNSTADITAGAATEVNNTSAEEYTPVESADYLEPIVIVYENCVLRIYKIPENVTPVSFGKDVTVSTSVA